MFNFEGFIIAEITIARYALWKLVTEWKWNHSIFSHSIHSSVLELWIIINHMYLFLFENVYACCSWISIQSYVTMQRKDVVVLQPHLSPQIAIINILPVLPSQSLSWQSKKLFFFSHMCIMCIGYDCLRCSHMELE